MSTRSRTFTGAALAQVALPLGGIGTGTVSLGGRGQLLDWEIFNRPGKGNHLERTFCALRIAADGAQPVCRVLERAHLPPFVGALGFQNQRLAGLPRFREAVFCGEYPFADIAFEDERVPAHVSLEAYNPFSPMNVELSSIPGAILNYRIENTGTRRIDVSLLATMQNPIGALERPGGWLGPGIDDAAHVPPPEIGETLNQYRKSDALRGIFFSAPHAAWASPYSGTAALTTPWSSTDCQVHLYRGPWWDGLHRLWDEFATTGRLTPLVSPAFGEPAEPTREKLRSEAGALCLHTSINPGEHVVLPVFIHWHFANARLWGGATAVPVRTYVANQFRDAWGAAEYTARELPRLDSETRQWRRTFFDSTLPQAVLDAVSSQITTLRSQTVLRLADGNIYAWEGCGDQQGSCAGNCTHVWNYEQTLAFLFPSLERTMRRIDFGPNMRANGSMAFRCDAPSGVVNSTSFAMHPCVDGQLGNVVQAYRDWQLSGDEGFLRDIWPNVKRALAYAWQGPRSWDPDKDGVMEGRQHNTYDIEFYGPNTMLGSIYLAALRAATAIAEHLGDRDSVAEYREIYARGRARLEGELWNGDYFVQRVELADGLVLPPHLRSPDDASFPKYQYGEGCLADQLIGQWEAHVCGLGHVLDPDKVRAALRAVFKHNFRAQIGDLPSVQRVFALNDEAGLVLCTWPRGGRPSLPFVYCDEVWTGIEYQVAAHLIYEGLVEEGLAIVRAVRARYDGVRRNPWDEIECGHHYARALSSWSLIQALSGAQYSAVDRSLTFAPRLPEPLPQPFRCFVAAGTGWGIVSIDRERVALELRSGTLALERFGLVDAPTTFATAKLLRAGDTLSVARSSVGRS